MPEIGSKISTQFSNYIHWLRKDHVIKWYNDADEWLNEIRARNAEFSFLHHYIVYVEDKPIGFGQWYDWSYYRWRVGGID